MEEYRPETIFKIETTDKREAMLMLNATRMAGVLYEILCWHRAVYNYKDYDGLNFVEKEGKLMTDNELYKYKQENGIIYKPGSEDNLKVQTVYTHDFIEHKIENLTDSIRDLIFEYYE